MKAIKKRNEISLKELKTEVLKDFIVKNPKKLVGGIWCRMANETMG